MNIAFYTGVSGMIAYQNNLNSISNNMANISTTGYKKTTNQFVDLLYSKIDTNVEGEHLVGHGVKTDYNDLLFSQGTLNFTNNNTDFAIVGEGFFALEQPDGSTAYTRDGSFTISMEGDAPYLVDNGGRYILDGSGERIELEFLPNTNTVDMSQVAQIVGIYSFTNPYGLTPIGNNAYVVSDNSGEAEGGSLDSGGIGQNEIIQSALEFSNVDMADEMVNMMLTQKGFTLSSKIVQTADQLQEIINNLR